MTICTVYVGDLESPGFKWEGGDWEGNVPYALSKEFPSTRRHYNGEYRDWVKEKGIECCQTDFGGWVARVTKEEIEDYLHYCYADDPHYADPKKAITWQRTDCLRGELGEILVFVETLDEKKTYALVATEF